MNKKKNQDNTISIDTLNMQRAFLSAVCAMIFAPIIGVSAGVVQWENGLKTFFLVLVGTFEVIQIVFLIVMRILMKASRIESYEKVYTSYFALTITLMMISSGCDMETFNSQIFYTLTCIYFVFVPVLKERMRLIFIVGQTLIMAAMMLIFNMGFRVSVDICLMQLCTVFVSRYEHGLMFRRQRMTSKLREKTSSSEHDALTGLMNRRGLERRADAIWPYCQRNKISVGMIALDIDYFKKYNDTFGHPQGDECLRQVAEVLRESARRSTDVVTRTGGEEFLIFVQDIHGDELPALALKIRKNLEKRAIPQAYCMVSKHVTVSIGIAKDVPGPGVTFKSIYEMADKALYEAKKNGRNCIVYEGNLYGRIRNGIAQVISM